MVNDIERIITIDTKDENERDRLSDYILHQLCYRKDWKDGNIVLDINEPWKIKIYIYKGCKRMPRISI